MIVSLRRPRSTRAETTSGDGAMPALRVRGLEKRYGDVEVLRGIDLDVERGEFLALLGPSGCGKTTSLRVIAGFERPHAGSIEIGGDRVYDADRCGWPVGPTRGAPGRHGLPGLRPLPPSQRGPQRRVRLAAQRREPRGPGSVGAGDGRAGRTGRAHAGPALGGPAAARGAGPRPGSGAGGDPARRAVFQPRCRPARIGARGRAADPARGRDDRRAGDPRSGRSAFDRRSGGGHARRQDRPGRVAGRALSPPRQPDDRRLHRRRPVSAGRGIGPARQRPSSATSRCTARSTVRWT